MECNAFEVKDEICAGQKDVMRRLSRDGKLCDCAEDWKTWFHLNYPGCGEDYKWAENNFKNDGVKQVKEERTTSNIFFIRGLSRVYERGQKMVWLCWKGYGLGNRWGESGWGVGLG